MLERQKEGMANAKAEGKCKLGKPTAQAKETDVLALVGQWFTKEALVKQLNSGVASVYRMLKA